MNDPPAAPENLLRFIGITLGKGVLYGLAFWAVYAFVYSPYFYSTHRGERYASEEEHSRQQTQQWDEQARRANEMMENQALMQKRYEALISKQEQHVQRMDAILDAWERQAHIKK